MLLVAFLVALAAYLVLFFAARPERWQCLAGVLLPDELVRNWVAGDFRQFHVADRVPVLLVAGAIWGLAGLLGRLSLAALHQLSAGLLQFGVDFCPVRQHRIGCGPAARSLTALDRFVFSVGLGLNELSLLTLTLGLLGALRWPWVMAGVLAVAAALATVAWRGRDASRGRPTGDAGTVAGAGQLDAASGWLERHGLWLGLPFLLVIVLGGMLPPWDFDVREYHLQVPKEWYQAGRIGFLPHNVYGNMPLGAELHALLAMVFMPGERNWWWGALAGKTVIAGFAPLGALTLLAAGQRFWGRRAGIVAALVYLSAPWVIQVSVHGLIDGAMAFYLLLAVYAMLLAYGGCGDAESPGIASRKWLAVAGFAAGSAVACKYTGLLFVVAPLTVWAAFRPPAGRTGASGRAGRRQDATAQPARGVQRRESRGAVWRRVDLRSAAVFVLAVACGCGLWLGKNWVLAGNPIYPLVFGGTTRTAEKDEQWRRAHRVPVDQHGRRYSFPQLAEAVRLAGWDSLWHSPLLVPLAALAVLVHRGRGSLRIVAAYAGFVFMAWWLLTHRIDRFLVPILPLIALLCGAGATWTRDKPWRIVLAALLGFGFLANWLTIEGTGGHDRRYLVALEKLRRDEPSDPRSPSRVSAAHRYLNDVVPAGRCVLMVGDAEVFDLEASVLYNTCFDDCLFERLLCGRDRAARLEALHAERISHVCVNWSEIRRYRSPGNYGFTDYVTPELVHDELVSEQGVLRKVALDVAAEFAEVFEVAPR
jgi:hypothetical protein